MEGEETTETAPEATPEEVAETTSLDATPEPAEAPPEAAPPETVEDALQTLLDAQGDDRPQWLKDQDITLAAEGKESFSVTKDVLDNLPIEAQRIIGNLRRMADRKASESANIIQSLEQREAAVKTRELELQASALTPLQTLLDPSLREMMKPPEGDQPDPATRRGQEWLAQKFLSERMGEFFGKIQEVVQTQEQEAAQAAQKAEADAWVSETEKYLDGLSDEQYDLFKQHQPAIKTLISGQKAAGQTLTAEQAFRMTLAAQGIRVGEVKEEKSEADLRLEHGARLTRRNKSALPTSPPANLSGRDLEIWYMEHPEALKVRYESLTRGRGTSLG